LHINEQITLPSANQSWHSQRIDAGAGTLTADSSITKNNTGGLTLAEILGDADGRRISCFSPVATDG